MKRRKAKYCVQKYFVLIRNYIDYKKEKTETFIFQQDLVLLRSRRQLKLGICYSKSVPRARIFFFVEILALDIGCVCFFKCLSFLILRNFTLKQWIAKICINEKARKKEIHLKVKTPLNSIIKIQSQRIFTKPNQHAESIQNSP